MDLNKIKKLNIPTSPGCYQYYNDKGKIIYIGKASNLKSRVSSYWRESADHSPAKEAMIKLVADIKWIETDTEIEALLLEANLVKKHQPVYNVLLRDDKRFIYIKISTEDKYPRIFATRTIDKAGKYFGPFTSTEAVHETLKIIRKIWGFRSCRQMPKRACLYYRISKCPGCCEEKISQKDYKETIKQIILFLSGEKKKIITNYELRITRLQRELTSGQAKLVSSKKNKNTKYKISDTKDNAVITEINSLKYQLKNLNHVIENSRIINVAEKYANDVVELAKILNLPNVPKRIEGYDISNIFGRDAVGSMVVFSNGEANKNEYRKFKIKIGDGEANDTGMIMEILERRLKHAPLINPPSPLYQGGATWSLPDLIIVDGGKGQVNAVVKILKKYKTKITVIGVSKGDGLRSSSAPDKLFFPGEKKPLELPIASPALHLIKRVRDEAHRFAIGYHRKLRSHRLTK